MSYQVVSARGDDVYAFVDDEADARRIDNAMRILLTSNTYAARKNPIDEDILEFIEQNHLKSMSHAVEILTKANIAITGQDTTFKLSNRIVPLLRYFFEGYGRGEVLDPNFFTTLAAFSRKEIATVINGFRSLDRVSPSGLTPSPSHNATPNLQTLYIFSKLCTSPQYGVKSIFDGLAEDIENSLSSEWAKNDDGICVENDELNAFFKQFDHYTKYQSLPITIEVLNASVEKMLHFGFDLPVFIRKSIEKDKTMVATYLHVIELDSEQSGYEGADEFIIKLRHALEDVEVHPFGKNKNVHAHVYQEVCRIIKSQSVKLWEATIRPTMFGGNRYRHVMVNVSYELGYVLPKQLTWNNMWDMSYAGSYTDLVFYTTSFMSYLLASSGDLFDSLKQPNVGISKCIQRFLDNASKGQLQADEIYDMFCSEEPQWTQRDFFKKGFLLYSRYIDLRARPTANTYTETYFKRRLYEIYRDHLDLLNDVYNALTFEHPQSTLSDTEVALAYLLTPYLPSALTTRSEDMISVLDQFVRDNGLHENLDTHILLAKEIAHVTMPTLGDEYTSDISVPQQKLRDEIVAVAEFYLNQAPTKFTEGFESLITCVLEIIETFEASAEALSVPLEDFMNERLAPCLMRCTSVYGYLFSWTAKQTQFTYTGTREYTQHTPNKVYTTGDYTLVKLGVTNPLNLVIGLKDISNCCMIFDNAGFDCSENSFFGENDAATYLLFNNKTNTFWGSSWAFGSNTSGIVLGGDLKSTTYRDPMYAIDQFELSYTGTLKNRADHAKAVNHFVEGVIHLEMHRFTEEKPETILYINMDNEGGLKSSNQDLDSNAISAWNGSVRFLGDTNEENYTRVVPHNLQSVYQDADSDKPCVYVSTQSCSRMESSLVIFDETRVRCGSCKEVSELLYMYEDASGIHDYLCESCGEKCAVCSEFYTHTKLEQISEQSHTGYLHDICPACRKECSECGGYFVQEEDDFDEYNRCTQCSVYEDEDDYDDEYEDY